ncbi:hypothetical protein D9756_003319 [Leucocoprinus leucothites]|uniref:Glucose receptor Git3 N-terminal domain-containing protein n=1 Tax=Leucocoprinus leucothites TaxID=201217 RepID=A0A8H5LJF4_9AGAR|nr:hypothetical protein D9756_003319 [Leucoagaricus leucothites]
MADGEFVPIPQIHYKGAIVISVFAVLSAVALLSVALRVIWLAIRKLWRSDELESQEYIFFRTQLGNYAACLLLGNMMNSAAGLMGLPWLVEKGITDGSVCRLQAFVMQVGNWASAYFTVAIAVHTFNSLVLKKKQSIFISLPTMVIGWTIAGIAASIPFFFHDPAGSIYGPAGLSCGVRAIFPKLDFILHLLPIFLASLLSAFLYSLIYLVLRGTLNIKGGIKLTLDPNGRWDGDMESYHRFIARVARSMLWFPITYITLLIPYSVMRLLVISGFSIAWEALVFASVCWFLLGVVNVLLLYNTFRILRPTFDGVSSTNNSRRTMESFGPTGYFLPYDEEKKATLQAQIDQYRFPVPLYQQSEEFHSRTSSQSSNRSLLPAYHDRQASAGSIPSLGRPISPADQFKRMFAEPPVPGAVPTFGSPKSQLSLDTSLKSLPAPPRRNVSPSPLSISSKTSSPIETAGSPLIVTPEGVWTPVTPPSARQPVRNPPPTSGPYEQWATHQVSQSWSSGNQQMLNQPSLSAVTATFPSTGPRPLLLSATNSPNTSPYSLNQPLPSYSPTQPRPLLLSRNSSAVGVPPGPGPYRPLLTPVPRAF